MSASNRVMMDAESWKRLVQEGRAPADAGVWKDVESEIRAGDPKTRQIRFRITTGAVDRMKDTINPKGWDLKNYLKNPVVLFAHTYSPSAGGAGLPIAKSVKIEADDKGLTAVAQFATREQYEFADTVYQLILGGFLKATSVGFKPKKHVYNEARAGVDFLEQELLEFSVVPIPANPEALVEGRSLDLEPLREWLDLQPGGRTSGRGDSGIILLDDEADLYILVDDLELRAIPANVSTVTAPKDEKWSAPALRDFTAKSWDKLSDADKRRIAGHYAFAEQMPPTKFSSLHLPHHRPSDGKVVYRGVVAALGRLDQVGGMSSADREAAKAHLEAHERAFGGKDVIEFDSRDLADAISECLDQALTRETNRLRGRVD